MGNIPQPQSLAWISGLNLFVGDTPEWEPRAFATIEQMAALEPDWGGNGEPAISPQIIERARSVTRILSELRADEPVIAPTFYGTVVFAWLSGQVWLEIEVCESGALDILVRDRRADKYQLFEGVETLRKALQQVGTFLQA